MTSRLTDLRHRLTARARALASEPRERSAMPRRIVEAAAGEKAAADAAGVDLSPEWLAVYRRGEVERLSLAGTPVAQIAAALGITPRHVTHLRAQLGIGRRR